MAKEHHHHADHAHTHGPRCGHTAIQHEGHTDYLHGGHLHTEHEGHYDECSIGVGPGNPDKCTPQHSCGAHGTEHVHGEGCGHEAVPHGQHLDYLVSGHLHHPHGTHCDDHGAVSVH